MLKRRQDCCDCAGLAFDKSSSLVCRTAAADQVSVDTLALNARVLLAVQHIVVVNAGPF